MSSLKFLQHVKMLLNNLTTQERIGDVEHVVLVLRSGRQLWGIGEERRERGGNTSFRTVTFPEQ